MLNSVSKEKMDQVLQQKTMSKSVHIKSKINHFKSELTPANLLAVTKYSEIEDVISSYKAGQKDFGESRVQSLSERANALISEGITDIKWHFIGHLQTNKINKLLKVPNLLYIHSIDSLKVLEALYKKEELFQGENLNFFLEFKTTKEEEKGGLATYDELKKCVEFIKEQKCAKFKFIGLMTMGPIRTETFEEDARQSFKTLRETRDLIQADFGLSGLQLSMGMSSDYSYALEEGTDWVRIGSAIFKD